MSRQSDAGTGHGLDSGRTYAPHEAVIEASRCLMCEDPPCNEGCPAGVDVRRFIRKIRFGNFRGAARLIRRANVMVGICGRVCPQEILCMENCTRGELDTPIDIAGLQRFAGDAEIAAVAPLPVPAEGRDERVAILGAGPAGLAAAVELRRRGFTVEVFERADRVGGVLSGGIPPFRLEPGLVEGELEYSERLGVRFHLRRSETDVDGLLSGGFEAVLLAVGLWRPYKVGLPGEELDGVFIAGDFLGEVARGGRPATGRRVVIVGGGNVAMDAAMAALWLGAERVDVCSLESYDELPAFRSEIEHAQSEGIEFHTRTKPVRILGSGGRVSGYRGIGIRWKVPGLLVPSNAEEIPGTEFNLVADTVIEAIGQGMLGRFDGVAADERGLIKVDPETMATSKPGVFAAGDATSGGATAVQAFAEGKAAAEGIARYIDSKRGGFSSGGSQQKGDGSSAGGAAQEEGGGRR